MTLSAVQHAVRRTKIGGSDIGAVLRRNPWKGPLEVWLDKTGRAPPSASTPRSRNGHRFEPVARAWYVEEHRVGAVVRVPGTIDHPSYDWWAATPDGIVWDLEAALFAGAPPDRGMEIKTHTVHLRHLYGDPMTDQVPAWEILQCAWNMGVTGIGTWDLVALIDGEFTPYLIGRDLELEGLMAEAAERFWVDHVLADVPPEPDGSDGYADELVRRYPRHRADAFVECDGATLAQLTHLRELRLEITALQQERDQIEQCLQQTIGDHEGIMFASLDGKGTQRVTWKLCKDTEGVDWEAAGNEAITALELRISAARTALAKLDAHVPEPGLPPDPLLAEIGETLEAIADDVGNLRAKHWGVRRKGSRRMNYPKGWGRGD